MEKNKQNPLEYFFEEFLWKARLITLLAVIFSLISSLTLFAAGSYQIWYAAFHVLPQNAAHPEYNYLLISIISAVDLYLIAIVLLIFSFGIYELFISKIDPARHEKEIDILEIQSLDDLKNRLFKVIIMALVVYFFKSILSAHFEKPLEILYMGLAILAVAASAFFIRKIDKNE